MQNMVSVLQLFLVSGSMYLQEGLTFSCCQYGIFIWLYLQILYDIWQIHVLHKPCAKSVCSVSSLAWFMSNQETSFVTLGQRVLAKPLK